jgi:hypothetical protein
MHDAVRGHRHPLSTGPIRQPNARRLPVAQLVTTWACFMGPMGEPDGPASQPSLPSCALLPCEDLLYIQLQGRAPRAGPGTGHRYAKAPRDGGADCVAAQHPPIAGWPLGGDRGAPGAGCLPLASSGHVGADAHSSPAADRTGGAPQRQQWRAGLQAGPSLRRPILKPCKIAGKGAPAARRLLAQAQTLARESWQGFISRQSEGWPGPSAAGVCSWLL